MDQGLQLTRFSALDVWIWLKERYPVQGQGRVDSNASDKGQRLAPPLAAGESSCCFPKGLALIWGWEEPHSASRGCLWQGWGQGGGPGLQDPRAWNCPMVLEGGLAFFWRRQNGPSISLGWGHRQGLLGLA